jgi:hypothetical protein
LGSQKLSFEYTIKQLFHLPPFNPIPRAFNIFTIASLVKHTSLASGYVHQASFIETWAIDRLEYLDLQFNASSLSCHISNIDRKIRFASQI